jgi:hypothetical protein
MQYGVYPKVGTQLWCPVCGKYFKATDDTRYIRWGHYVCAWKCFRDPSTTPIAEAKTGDAVPTEKVVKKKSPKVDKSEKNTTSKVTKNTSITPTKQSKSTKITQTPTKKGKDKSQKAHKKCDKVELF